MIGARLADLRDWNNQTQEELAKALNVATSTIRSWEHEKSSPNHEMLIAICRYYGTSADYLLGLTDIDPSDEARKQRQRLTEEEQNEMQAAQRDRKVAGRLFYHTKVLIKYLLEFFLFFPYYFSNHVEFLHLVHTLLQHAQYR